MLKHLFIGFLLLISGWTYSQITTSGTTTQTSCNCYDLTQDGVASSVGSFYQLTPISLTSSFSYPFTVNFGCSNTGGEGVAFVLQNGAWTEGSSGAGLGYQGVTPSLSIEFDTRDNETSGQNTYGDIPADHVAIQTNGSIDHNGANNLVSPTNILSGVANVEDCEDHSVVISWDATAYTFDVIVDGVSSFGGPIFVGDITTNVFGGNPLVNWGWTGSTGVVSNTQSVCLALEPEITYSATNCPGQTINFTGNATSFYGVPATGYSWDFDGLGTSTNQNPSFAFATAGNHPVTLSVTDNTGCTNDLTLDVGVGFQVDVTADATTVCENTTTQLYVDAQPYVGNDCCFELILTDSWDDGWSGNYLEVFVDGSSVGTFSPAVQGLGTTYYETHDICFTHGSAVEIVANGNQFPGECAYELKDQNGLTIVSVPIGSWMDGDVQSFTVDCGITPPAYTYLWDSPGILDDATSAQPIATISSDTTLTVEVTDPNTSCVISQSITISTFPTVSATLSGYQTICQGDNTTLDVTFTGTAPYDIDVLDPDGNTTSYTGITANPYSFTANINGTYTLVSVTGNGCSGTVSGSGVVNVIIPPDVDIEASANYCDGETINPLNVVSTNGGTVNWYSDATLTTLIHTGNSYTPTQGVGTQTYYAQEVESVLGCAGVADNVVITVYAIPPAPTVSGTTTYCEGESATALTATLSMGGNANWYDNVTLTPPALATTTSYTPTLSVGTQTYYVTESANGCEGPSTQLNVTTNPTPVAPTVSGSTTYCEGETATALSASNELGGNIQWYTNFGTLIASGATYTPDISLGNQTFNVTETFNGCESNSSTVSVTVNVLPIVNLPPSAEYCYGDSTYVTAVHNGFDLLWDNNDTYESTWLTDSSSGYVYITSTNPLCGSTTDSIYITVHSLPTIIAYNDTVVGIGGEVSLWAEGGLTYEWTPTPTECVDDDCAEIYTVPSESTTYVVIGTDQYGCMNSDTVNVEISGYMEVFVPNVFSPNGDGWNDVLQIQGPRLFNYQIQIFDRWGKLMYESNDQKTYWDGKYQGQELAPQTFVYILVGETVLGEEIKQTGNVTIIK